MTALRVELFGGFQLLSDGEPIRPPASKVARSLLAYLLLHRDRVHVRSGLVGMFWPDEPEADARRKFSQNLWRIRQALQPVGHGDLIICSGDDVRVADDKLVDVDVLEFVRGTGGPISPGSESSVPDLLEAVELYKGEFLHGFYDDWVVVEQRRTAELYLRALGQAVQALKAIGASEEALIYARKLTWQEPLREEAHRDVMRLCRLLGRPMEALRQYERLEEDLYRELGVEPEPKTKALFEAIAHRRGTDEETSRSESVVELPATSPFIGRQAERTRGIDIVEQTIAGHGSVLLVEGEPGVGKTRFLDEIAVAATWRGVEVLRGSATSGTTVPFGVIRSALGTGMTALRAEQLVEQVDPLWLTEVTRVVPQLAEWLPDLTPAAPLGSGEGRDRMIEAITIVLSAFGRITPHLIIFDDLHWADSDSIDVIRQMALSSTMRRTSIFVAFRGAEGRAREDVWSTLRELDRAGAHVLTLESMPATEVEQLVRWAAGDERSVTAATPEIMRETGGNPLFVIETTRALVESGGVVSDETLPVTDGIKGVIAERLQRLSENEQELVGAMAARGDAVTSSQLFKWCAMSRGEVLDGLTSLISRRFVVEVDAGYDFTHDQLRRVAYELALPEERIRFHRVIAETLEIDGLSDPAVLAHHLHMAGQRARAFRYWVGAARDAATIHAYGTAAEFYESAFSSVERAADPAHYAQALAGYEQVLEILGRRDRQREILELWSAAAADDLEDLARVRVRQATFAGRGDDYVRAIELAEEAVNLAMAAGVSPHHARLAAGRALHWAGQTEQAIEVFQRAATDEADDPEAALALGSVLGQTQQYRSAKRHLGRALDTYRLSGDRRGEAEALGLLALVAEEMGDGAMVQSAFQEAIELCTNIGFTRGRATNQVNYGTSRYSLGETGQALRLLSEARESFVSIGHGRGAATAGVNEATILHLVIGDDETAGRLLEDSRAFFEQSEPTGPLAHCLELLGSIAHRAGHTARGTELLDRAVDVARAGADLRRARYALTTRALVMGAANDTHAALADITSARVGAGPELVVRLDAIEAWLRAASGDARAWELSQRSFDSRRAGIPLAWTIPYYHGLAAERLGHGDEAREAFLEAWDLLDSALADVSTDLREQALSAVPENADIRRRWSELQPIDLAVQLASKEAPTGRPLRADEVIEVRWALDRSTRSGGAGARRRGLIELSRQAEQQGAAPTVDDLAAALDVSRATIKRDLVVLRSEGRAPLTRGARSV